MPAQLLIPREVFRIFSIDPGTNALGVAVLDVNIVTDDIEVAHATTLNIGKLYQQYEQVIRVHGERVAKLHAAEKSVLRMLNAWQPHAVVSESPYMGRFPQAYAALVECVSAVRRAVMQYDRHLPLSTIDPATVKKSVGVSGKSGDKNAVAAALGGLKGIVCCPPITLAQLDEHAIDAIAVGYALNKQLKQGS